jgi:hypothetical protein
MEGRADLLLDQEGVGFCCFGMVAHFRPIRALGFAQPGGAGYHSRQHRLTHQPAGAGLSEKKALPASPVVQVRAER